MVRRSRPRHILIAGGAGFIGSHLCDFFLKRGDHVFCVDNLITGSLRNLSAHRKNKKFDFIRHDIIHPLTFKAPLDFVLNFASPASPPDYRAHPLETLRTGSEGTFRLLELARVKKAVTLLASTSEVYGDPEVTPQREGYFGHVNPIGPRSVYDEAKRFSEALVMAFHRRHKLNTRIVRIFNTYGPRMRPNDGRAIPNFICQALLNRPMTVYGKGTQTRSFCYVSDLVEGIAKLLTVPYHEPVNLGSDREITILEMARKVCRLTQSKSEIVFRPLPEEDPKRRRPDLCLAQKKLHWKPRVSLKEGLIQTVRYFQSLAL